MTGRELHQEWVGKTALSAVPDKVVHRLLDRCEGLCQSCGRPLRAGLWNTDHKIALQDWQGQGHGNRESNLQLLCTICHTPKTSLEAKLRAKLKKKRATLQFPGKRKTKHPIKGWKRMDGTPVYNPAYWNRGGRGGGRRS